MQPEQGFIADAGDLFQIAKDGYQKVRDKQDKGLKIHRDNNAIVAILFSALALEAFINELLAIAKMEKEKLSEQATENWPDNLIEAIEEPSKEDNTTQKDNSWIKCLNRFLNRYKLELRSIPVVKRKSTREKYMLASEALTSPFDKGSAPYQDFALLCGLRDCLVHLKPEDMLEFDEDQKIYTSSGRTLLNKLRSKGILSYQSNAKDKSVFSRGNSEPIQSITLQIRNIYAAKWACETTSKMVIAILDKLNEIAPSSFTKDNQVLALYREDFQPPT